MMLSKYFLVEVVELDDITNYLAFFLAKGDSLQQEVLRAFSTQLRQILTVFEGLRGQRFISSSICLIYDGASPDRAEVRLIDFGRLTEEGPEFKDS